MANINKAIFAGGCFWGIEHIFNQQEGVIDAVSGYIGGIKENPTYKEVCTGTTQHAEAVEVTFDSDTISYNQLLDLFWRMHNPTQVNRQGIDIGTQYRTEIFYLSPEQKQLAEESLTALANSGKFAEPIATKITEATTFYPAEEYHQRYFEKNPNAACEIHLRED